jgi:hypothetical protein
MSQFNDALFAALRERGYVGALPDMRYAFFKDNGLSTWRQLYVQSGGTGQLNDWLLEQFQVPAEPLPTCVIEPTAPSVIEGAVITFTAVVTGYPPGTYQWSVNGVDVVGATTLTYAHTTVLADNAGTVICTVTDGLGRSVPSNVATMTVAATPPQVWFDSTVTGIWSAANNRSGYSEALSGFPQGSAAPTDMTAVAGRTAHFAQLYVVPTPTTPYYGDLWFFIRTPVGSGAIPWLGIEVTFDNATTKYYSFASGTGVGAPISGWDVIGRKWAAQVIPSGVHIIGVLPFRCRLS